MARALDELTGRLRKEVSLSATDQLLESLEIPRTSCGEVACILKNMLDFEITTTELSSRLAGGKPADLLLLDVREPWEYATAQIDGSTSMPMGEIPARLQELDPEAHIVTICHAGVRSMNVAVWLRNQGLEKVQSLRGGIDAWSREVDPKVPRY
jgi:rhodanese-related sulfurtransferase